VVEDISILAGNRQLAELHHQDVKLEIYHQERQAAAE